MSLAFTFHPLSLADADAVVLFSRSGDDAPRLLAPAGLPGEAREHIDRSLATLRAKGSADELVKIVAVPGIAAPLVAVAGLGVGKDESVSAEKLRRAAGTAVRGLAGRARVAMDVPDASLLGAADLEDGGDEDQDSGDPSEPGAGADPVALVAALAEGAALGAYRFTRHRGAKAQEKAAAGDASPVAAITLHAAGAADSPGAVEDSALDEDAVREVLARAEVLCRWQHWARDLVNTAPNELYPQTFADEVAARAGASVRIAVLAEAELAAGSCGGHIGVGQGSVHPPRLVTMTYQPAGATAHLAYVGKGITFDSGGLSIKTGTGMMTMKCDMAGAAAVAAAVFACAELQLPVAVTGYLCLAENMPSATAQRPGDVVTMPNGQTVEILNTDAEGRLVLADGLCLASEAQPDVIVDVATLTGAAIVALGKRTAGLLANDDQFQAEVALAAADAGEPVWPMPMPEELRATLDSLVADIKHIGELGVAGMLSAAVFLREFVGRDELGRPIPWAHVDVAGPAYNDGAPFGYTPKAGTGYAVRTLVALAEGRS